MKSMDDMTREEVDALKPGDEVRTTSQRSADFRTIVADGGTALGAYPHTVLLSVTRSEPRDVTTIGIAGQADDNAVPITVHRVTARPVTLEEAQIRMSPSVAMDIAITLIANVLQAMPELARESFDAQPVLKNKLLGNVG